MCVIRTEQQGRKLREGATASVATASETLLFLLPLAGGRRGARRKILKLKCSNL